MGGRSKQKSWNDECIERDVGELLAPRRNTGDRDPDDRTVGDEPRELHTLISFGRATVSTELRLARTTATGHNSCEVACEEAGST